MNVRLRKERTPKPDHFVFFKQAVVAVFEALTRDYDFEHVSATVQMPECVVKYRNTTTGVNVTYELKSSISVDLIQLERTSSGEVVEDRTYDLLLLMEIRQPDLDRKQFYGADKEWTNDYIETVLLKYVTFLKNHARDVLTGDFSIFPELKKLSAHYRRQKNKEYFGTYSGETPRFSVRPTLTEVFAGAKDVDPELEKLFRGKLNQDKTQSRIYEAYWDHNYSVSEIASFLNRSEGSIKRELDNYDDRD
jgi:hypothetical protein